MINEFAILMNILARRTESKQNPNIADFGAQADEICSVLHFTGRMAPIQFTDIMHRFTRDIAPLGLVVRRNPFTDRWFVTSSQAVIDFFGQHPFDDKRSLPATLCAILALCLSSQGVVNKSTLQELRKKQDLVSDLKELEQRGFIIQEGGFIHINPHLGYYIDIIQFEEFLDKISSQISSSKNT